MTPETVQIGKLLAAFFSRQKLTQTQVGQQYSVTQSRIGRIYVGNFTVRSRTARKMCEEASIPFLDSSAEGEMFYRNRNQLVRLIDSVWKGTQEDATFIAESLRAISKLRKAVSRSSTNSRGKNAR